MVAVLTVAQVVLPEVTPDHLDRIQFRRVRRQWQEGDVIRDPQASGVVPTRLIENQQHLDGITDLLAEVAQLDIHGVRVGGGHQPAVGRAGCRANGTEQINPFVLRLTDSARMASPVGPNPSQRALLAEARLVLEPDFDLLAGIPGLELLDTFREFFLKSAWACSLASRCFGRGTRLEKLSR